MRSNRFPCSQIEPDIFGVLLRKPGIRIRLTEQYIFSVIQMK